METDLNNPVFESFLKYDEQIRKMEEQLQQKASQFGFENEEFIKNNLPMLEKKYGPVNNFDNDDPANDLPPMPDPLPSHLQSKVIKYNTKAASTTNKQSEICSFDQFKKTSKKKTSTKASIPTQSFAPLKKAKSDKDHMFNETNFEYQKQEVATKTATYKSLKESRYGALPPASMVDSTTLPVEK
jgi:hypothetical protein